VGAGSRRALHRLPHLVLSTSRDWQAVGRTLARRFKKAARPTARIRRLVARLTRDCAGPQEKVLRLHRYVATAVRSVKVRWNRHGWPIAAAPVTARRLYGHGLDKAALLAASLQVLGLRARPVLYARCGQLEPAVVHLGFFERVGLQLDLPGQRLWLEVDTPKIVAGGAPVVAGYTWAFSQTRATPQKAALQPSRRVRKFRITVQAAGARSGGAKKTGASNERGKKKRGGGRAGSAVGRNSGAGAGGGEALVGKVQGTVFVTGRFNPYGKKSIQKPGGLAKLAARWFAQLRFAKVQAVSLGATGSTFAVAGTVRLQKRGKRFWMVPLAGKTQARFAKWQLERPTRATDLWLDGPWAERLEVAVCGVGGGRQQGGAVVAAPAPSAVKNALGRFERKVERRDGCVRFVQHLAVRRALIRPSAYAKLRALLGGVAASAKAGMVFYQSD
jgi:hypothetical protein